MLSTEFSFNGFKIIPNVLTPEACDLLISAIEKNSTTTNMRQPHIQIPEIQPVLRQSNLHDFFNPPWQIIRSIFFDKTLDANWSVPWHQDITICVRERREAPGFGPWSLKDGLHHVHAPAEILNQIITLRLHLDECDPQSGPLRVFPSSHLAGHLSDVSLDEYRATHNEVSCLVPKGGALVMKPLLLHASSRAKNPGHRRVLHFELTRTQLPFGLEWIA